MGAEGDSLLIFKSGDVVRFNNIWDRFVQALMSVDCHKFLQPRAQVPSNYHLDTKLWNVPTLTLRTVYDIFSAMFINYCDGQLAYSVSGS